MSTEIRICVCGARPHVVEWRSEDYHGEDESSCAQVQCKTCGRRGQVIHEEAGREWSPPGLRDDAIATWNREWS